MMEPIKKAHTGLSISSLNLFLDCNRKYYHEKIANTKPDDDIDLDQDALLIGSAFHKVLEETKHNLNGLTFEQCRKIISPFNMDHEKYDLMIFAMLGKYSAMHEKTNLKVLACEVELETKFFYGFVDVILVDEEGKWWIADMKTASSFTDTLIPTLPMHPQLNIYAFYAPIISEKLGIKVQDFQGCRYRLTTKTKLKQLAGETNHNFFNRMSKVIRSYDFVIPKMSLNPMPISLTHDAVREFIDKNKDEASYLQRFENCTKYYRPCKFWSQCNGKKHSEMQAIEAYTSE